MANQKVNIKQLQQEATELKALLEKYAEEDELASKCMEELEPFFDDIAFGQVEEPFPQIPCSKYFIDDTLGNYKDLSEAYSKFANTAEGVDRAAVKKFLDSLNNP